MPVSTDSLIKVIQSNKTKRAMVSKIIDSASDIVPVVSKLTKEKGSRPVTEKPKDVNRSILNEIYRKVKSTSDNSKNIITLFPDIELAIQILVSSIISPKTMVDTELQYKLDKVDNLPPTVSALIVETLNDYLDTNYELSEKLPDILRESLFNSGAYAIAVLPEASVDEVINSDIVSSFATEEYRSRVDYAIDSMIRPINLIEGLPKPNNRTDPRTVDELVSSMASQAYVNLTDNANILKFPTLKDKIVSSIVRSNIRSNTELSMESTQKIEYLDIFRERKPTVGQGATEVIKTKEETFRKSIGKPLTFNIPTESIIPIFIPGDESNHVGYLVLLDDSGKPLSTNISDANLNSLGNMVQTSNTTNLTVTQKAYNALVYSQTNSVSPSDIYESYKGLLETQLYNSIKRSVYGSNVEIANRNDIYFMMFTRALADQKTNLLFLPKDLVVYFAFYYNDIGIGKSLLENLSVLSSLRAMLLFSKVMAYAKHSIDVTKVNISLDPNDPDPEKTIEMVQDSVLKLRQNFFPLGINNPVDLVTWIQRAGLQFAYENNPLLPNVRIDFENANLQHTIPESDLEEELRKQTILALGLSPETIDSGFSPEFATTVVNNNILLSKRVNVYQRKLKKHLTKLVSLVLYNDEDLRSKLKTIISDNIEVVSKGDTPDEKQLLQTNRDRYIEYILDKITNNIYVELPKPDNTDISTTSAEFDNYKDSLEKVLDSIFAQEVFSENISGELSNHIDTIKNVYKAHLLREWCSINNHFPEALEFTSSNEEDIKKLLANISTSLSYTMRNSDELIKTMQKFKEAVNVDLADIDGESATSSSDTSSDDSGDDFDMGTDDSSSEELGSDTEDLGEFEEGSEIPFGDVTETDETDEPQSPEEDIDNTEKNKQ